MDDTGAPKLDPRSHDDVIAQTEALATAYTSGETNGPWLPDGPTPTLPERLHFGGTLIRLFVGMVDHLIGQLNQVADKHHRAFTGLLGARRTPPRPARVPVTFTLAAGAAVGVVPEGAQIAAAGPEGPVVFETELALPLTRARLAAAFVRDVAGGGYADRTAIATGAAPGSFAALGEGQPIEHELYVAAEDLLAVPGAQNLTVTLDAGTNTLPGQQVTWSKANASGGWTPLPPVTVDGHKWVVQTTAASVGAITVGGVAARWLRATVPVMGVPPPDMKVTTAVGFTVDHKIQIDPTALPTLLVPFDAAYSNGQPVDFTRDILPFGDRPKFNDTFYFASNAGFAFAGTAVTLNITLTPWPGGTNATNPVLKWETWDGQTATALTITGDTTNAFRANGAVTFTIPSAIPRSTIGSVTSRWLRVRLVGGDYGKDFHLDAGVPVAADFRPPMFAAATLTWTGNSPALAPSALVRRTAMTFTSLTSVAATPVSIYLAAPELTYQANPDTRSSLQLGFDRAFEPTLTTLYVQVLPPASPDPTHAGDPPAPRTPPRLAWEYWNGSLWIEVAVEDGTQGLSRSGLVRFLPPADSSPLTQFGSTLRWLRARALDVAFSPMPRIGRVLLNTVLADHAHTTTREVVGASSGVRDQELTLSQKPVLEGQRIEVGEPEPPRGAELAALQAIEGDDVLTPDPVVGTWVRWHEVPDFWASGPRDRHYTFDAETGVVTFGNGAAGMIPPSGVQNIRAALYRSGGGTAGNAAAGTVTQLKTTVVGVESVTNHEPAVGGASIEPETALLARAARTLRHGGRAVTVEDFADLALESSRAVSRAAVLTPVFSPLAQADAAHLDQLQRDGQVIVVIVPAAVEPGQAPSVDLCAEVEDYLRARCAPDARVSVTGPSWIAADIVIGVAAKTIERSDALRVAVRDAIGQLLDPLTGGAGGDGWELGRQPRASDVVAHIAALPDLDHVSAVTVTCEAPFDVAPPLENDPQHAHSRLLVYARTITVTAS